MGAGFVEWVEILPAFGDGLGNQGKSLGFVAGSEAGELIELLLLHHATRQAAVLLLFSVGAVADPGGTELQRGVCLGAFYTYCPSGLSN
jgi:hypothetical protein